MSKLPAIKNYQIRSATQLLRDAKSVKFHVENDDYFGTAATLLQLIRQNLAEQTKSASREDWTLIEKTFKNLEQDLLLLQKNYHIKANKKTSQTAAKGKLKSQ